MTCEEVVRQVPLLLYGELSFDDEENVQQHLDNCEACREEAGRVRALQKRLDECELDVEPALLMESRRNLQARIANLASSTPRGYAFREFFNTLVGGSSWGGALAAAALLAVGFFSARLMPNEQAARTPGPFDPVTSRVRYVEPSGAGQVEIVLEETRQRTLSGDMGDERIRNLLLTAARESADPGVRVETMNILKNRPNSEEVRTAMFHALRHDTNAGVRLKALEGLRASAGDPATRKVLASVLLSDENPGVRTQAIDLLIQKKEPGMVGVLQEVMLREDNSYVRMKCRKALNEMNASVETF